MTDKPLEICVCKHSFHYSLKDPDSRDVKLYLSQNYAPKLFDVGSSGKIGFPENLPEAADLIVLSEHPRDDVVLRTLQSQSDQHNQIIVAPVGLIKHGATEIQAIYVIAPRQPRTVTEKISFDMEDQRGAKANTLRRGQKLHIFKTPVGRFSVLNCHDYTHSDLIDILLPEKLDFLIVCSNNTASRLFREYALSDVHHMFGYIILSNVASFGGSGVYGPIAKFSDGDVRVSTSGTLFEASGPSYATSLIPLPVKYLNGVREAYLKGGDPAKVKYGDPETGEHRPVLPPECFTSASPHYREILAGKDPVKTVDLDNEGYRFFGNLSNVTVTIAQLFTPDMDAYRETSYRPGAAQDAQGRAFLSKVSDVLSEFDRRQTAHDAPVEGASGDKRVPSDQKSSFLLLPEVFLPESLEDDVRALVLKHNVIVLSGLEYEAQADPALVGTGNAKGAKRSRIYIPANGGVVERTYLKMTRSQYDARWCRPSEKDTDYPFEIKRGSRLMRFTSASGVNFGILVCYDISQFEIIDKINEEGPLDVLFVLSHNPFAELYRNICLATSHRFYQFIAMCNVAKYGGSGVFGPLRTQGTRRTLAYLGQNTEAVVDIKLNIAALREARWKPDQELALKKGDFQRKPGRYQIRLKPVT
jgi:predicted amidohydrolase